MKKVAEIRFYSLERNFLPPFESPVLHTPGMKKIALFTLSLLFFGSLAQATMLECKMSGAAAEKDILHVQFEGESLDHPANAQAELINDGKNTQLRQIISGEDQDDVIFFENKKTKHTYSITQKGTKGTFQAVCTEPKMMGMMLPCDEGADYRCKKVKNL